MECQLMTHASPAFTAGRKVFTVLLAIALALTWMSQAQADGTAANKLAVAGSETVGFGANTEVRVLDETMKVSSVRDLILQLTSECTIVNALSTGSTGASPSSDSSVGRVTMRLEID